MTCSIRPDRGALISVIAAIILSAQLAVARDISAIKRSETLVSAVPDFNAPPFFFERGGELKGIDIDLARDLAASLGVGVKFNRDGRTFNDACALVAAGKADIAAAKISRTVKRAEYLLFSQPYIVLPHALILNRVAFAKIARGRAVAEVMQNYTGTIGVIAGSSFADFGRVNFPKAGLITFPTWEDEIAAVVNGTISAAYRDAFEVRTAFKTRPDLSVNARAVVIDDIQDTIGVAVAGDNYLLQNYINLYLDQKKIHYTLDQVMSAGARYASEDRT